MHGHPLSRLQQMRMDRCEWVGANRRAFFLKIDVGRCGGCAVFARLCPLASSLCASYAALLCGPGGTLRTIVDILRLFSRFLFHENDCFLSAEYLRERTKHQR